MDAALTTLCVATFINAAMPGPCAVLAASRTARCGTRSGLLVSAGVVGGATALSILALGVLVGALSVAGSLLVAMKWVGVAALVLLAARTLCPASPAAGSDAPGRGASRGDLFAGAAVLLSSPSSLVFLLALLPQFVPAGTGDLGPGVIASVVFIAGVAATQTAAVLLARCSVRSFRDRTHLVDRASAMLLVGFAAAAAFSPVG